ncbi:MAG: hypothetical protein KAJ29_03845 [Alphaproteobacteria bacterium]|nr:hypothetical protein [Alphaproteobacteria bacterium]
MFCFLKKLISKHPPPACTEKAETKNSSKYAVYIFYPNPNKNCSPQWRKVGATHSAKRAVKQARLLHKKQQYQRIEVKECSFSKDQNRNLCKTIRVYNKKHSLPW